MRPRQLIPEPDAEALAEGATWLCDLVAAVDHLRRGIRPGLTVWDTLEEALRWPSPDPATSTPPSRPGTTPTRYEPRYTEAHAVSHLGVLAGPLESDRRCIPFWA